MNFKKKLFLARVRKEIIGARFLLWIALFSVFQLCLALYAQHHAGIEPCRLCVLIRADILLIAIAGFAGYFGWRHKPVKMLANGLALVAAGAGLLHAYSLLRAEGVLFALDDLSQNCRNPKAFPDWFALDVWLPQVFGASAICGAQPWALAGFPMSLMSLLVFFACFIIFCYRFYSAFAPFPAKWAR